MKVVIIEDEEFAARRLENMIRQADPAIDVVSKLESVEESVEWFRKNPHPDLIFLDIHLEDDLSFSIFDKVKVTSPIIFTTAYDEYAIKAFKLKSIDYLLKPIVQEELNKAIVKYKEWNRQPGSMVDINSLVELMTTKTPRFKERFSITVGQKIKTVYTKDVAYFYSTEGMTFMVLSDKHEYPIDYSLDKLTNELDPQNFFRINRQFFIKLSSIGNVHIFPKSRLKLELNPPSKEDVFVSLDKVTSFKNWLDGETRSN